MRFAALALALVVLIVGCGGGGGRSSLPSAPGGGGSGGAVTVPKGTASVSFSITIPKKGASSTVRRPTTVSPDTKSFAVSVNGAAPAFYNTSSSICTTVQDGLQCTLSLGVPSGPATFVVTTYSAANGSGSPLNQGAAPIVASLSSPNSLPLTLSNVVLVTTSADSGAGSLRAAVAAAQAGDWIMFATGTGTVTLASPIVPTQNVTISGGPGPSNGVILSGGNTSQVLKITSSSLTVGLVGLTVANGKGDTGGGVFNCGTLQILNAAFNTNNVTPTGHSGGAIANSGSGVLNVYQSTFTGNTNPVAGGEAGAIYNEGQTFNVFSSTFTNNVAMYGGGIGSENDMTVSASTFTGNIAQSDGSSEAGGGAIFADYDVSIDGSTFTGNTVTGSAGSQLGGGAIYQNNYDNNGLTLTNSTLSNNTAGGGATDGYASGGAIYDDSGGSEQLTNVTFTGNKATGLNDSFGGAIAVDSSSGTWIQGSGLTFNQNAVTSDTPATYAGGGAIGLPYGQSGSSLIVTGAVFTGNTVSVKNGYGAGGAIDAEAAGGFSISGASSFTSNSATSTQGTYGGAVEYFACDECSEQSVVRKSAGFATKRPTHTRLPATLKRLNVRSAPARTRKSILGKRRPSQIMQAFGLSGVTFTSNSALVTGGFANGGAVDYGSQQGGTFVINGGSFSSNTSNGVGGALSLGSGSGSVTIMDALITGNSTAIDGGGIYNETNLTVNTTTIANNTVTASGGKGGGGGGIYNASTMGLNRSTLSGNTVAGATPQSDGGGGGIRNAETFTAANSTIVNNGSSGNGGGIENSGSTTLQNVTIAQNHATGSGGSVYNTSLFCFYNTIVAGGIAATGAEIENMNTLQSNDYNLVQGVVDGSYTPAAHDIIGLAPGLLGLASNGGPTQTTADQLNPKSPGQGAIPFASTCGGSILSTDQRGYGRGAGGVCDIGAYEFSATPGPSPTPTPAPTDSK